MPPMVPKPLSVGCLPSLEALPNWLFCLCTQQIGWGSFDSEFRLILLMPVWEQETIRKKVVFIFYSVKGANHASQSTSMVLQTTCVKGLFFKIQDWLLLRQIKAIWKDHEGTLCLQIVCVVNREIIFLFM